MYCERTSLGTVYRPTTQAQDFSRSSELFISVYVYSSYKF